MPLPSKRELIKSLTQLQELAVNDPEALLKPS
jgi:hypothetical protein